MLKAKQNVIYLMASSPIRTWTLTYLRQCDALELDRNTVFYSFCRLIATVVNTNAPVYARQKTDLSY